MGAEQSAAAPARAPAAGPGRAPAPAAGEARPPPMATTATTVPPARPAAAGSPAARALSSQSSITSATSSVLSGSRASPFAWVFEDAAAAAVARAAREPALRDPAADPEAKARALENAFDALLEAGPEGLAGVDADALRAVVHAVEIPHHQAHLHSCRLLWLVLSGVRLGWDPEYFPPLYVPSRLVPPASRKLLRKIDRHLVDELAFPFPIIPLLHSSDGEVVRYATASLCLVLGRRDLPRLRDRPQVLDSLIDALIANLAAADQRVQLVSVSALTSLSAHIVTHNAIVDGGAIEHLATFLHSDDSSTPVVCTAARCLRILVQRSPLLCLPKLAHRLPDGQLAVTAPLRRVHDLIGAARETSLRTVTNRTTLVDCLIILTGVLHDETLLDALCSLEPPSVRILPLTLGVLQYADEIEATDLALAETLSDLCLHLCTLRALFSHMLSRGGYRAVACALSGAADRLCPADPAAHERPRIRPRTYASLYATEFELEQRRSRRAIFVTRALLNLCADLCRISDTTSAATGASRLVHDVALPALFEGLGTGALDSEADSALAKHTALRNTARRAAASALGTLALREQWARAIFSFRNGAFIARLIQLGSSAHAICARASRRHEALTAGPAWSSESDEKLLMHEANAAVLLHLAARALSTLVTHDRALDGQSHQSKMLVDLWEFFALASQSGLSAPLPIGLLSSLHPNLPEISPLHGDNDDAVSADDDDDDDDTDSTDRDGRDHEHEAGHCEGDLDAFRRDDGRGVIHERPINSDAIADNNGALEESKTVFLHSESHPQRQETRGPESINAPKTLGKQHRNDQETRSLASVPTIAGSDYSNVALDAALIEASLGKALIQIGFQAKTVSLAEAASTPPKASGATKDAEVNVLTWTCKWLTFAESMLEDYPHEEHIRVKCLALFGLAFRHHGWVELWQGSSAQRVPGASPRSSQHLAAAAEVWPWDDVLIDHLVGTLENAAAKHKVTDETGDHAQGSDLAIDAAQVATLRAATRGVVELLQPTGFERNHKLLAHLKFASAESLCAEAAGNGMLHVTTHGAPKHTSDLRLPDEVAHNAPWGVSFTNHDDAVRITEVSKIASLGPHLHGPNNIRLGPRGWTISVWLRHDGSGPVEWGPQDQDQQQVHVLAATANGEFPVAALATCDGIELGCVQLVPDEGASGDMDHLMDFFPSLFDSSSKQEEESARRRPIWHGAGFALDSLSPGWHHLVVLCDGASTRFFVDRVQQGDTLEFACTETSLETIGNALNLQHAFLPNWILADFRLYGVAIPYMTVVASPVRVALNRRPWELCNAMDVAHEYARIRLGPIAVPALVAILEVDVVEIRHYAAEALLLLASVQENVQHIVAAGADKVLSRWAHSPVGLVPESLPGTRIGEEVGASGTGNDNDAYVKTLQACARTSLMQVLVKLQ